MNRSYESPLRAQQAAATAERIVEAAAELVVSRPGEHLTMAGIAEHAGVALRTVYRHFPSRDDLIEAMGNRVRRGLGLEGMPRPTSVDELRTIQRSVVRAALADEPFQRAKLLSPEERQLSLVEAEERLAWVRRALEADVAGADEWEVRRLVALVRVLFATRTYFQLLDVGGVSPEEAEECLDWALLRLVEATGRNEGEGGIGADREGEPGGPENE
ncbi:MAG: TetR/AcrR family transcriptional regulator [Acidimicrobiia bacterium]|nr:TetR/AcrR family transcriptional regulator [Acidimicrobiia bacterium]MCC5954383.1 TetR/AcrR family transcriptional regulator [Acidimicrobiia bacterium]